MKLLTATTLFLCAGWLASCSSGPSPATKSALAACQALVNLGNDLNTTHGGVQGSDIQTQLESAKVHADNAAHDDASHWTQLSKDVDDFVTALEGGTNASRAQTQAVEADCTRFVTPASPTT